MEKDKKIISLIINNLMPEPKGYEVYKKAMASKELENYIEWVREKSLGWMYGYACSLMDKNKDLRTIEVPDMLDRARADLAEENWLKEDEEEEEEENAPL